MSREFDRRQFVRGVAGVGGVLGLSATGLLLPGCKTTQGTGSNTLSGDDESAGSLRVRKSITDPSNALNVQLYSKAIGRMKATKFPRPIPDEKGKNITTDWWDAHALIHMNNCPHGNWYFLPWHRAYLYYFERVIQKFSGDPSFALPYWDWTKDGHIPAQFWTDAQLKHPVPSPNPRGYSARDISQSDSVDTSDVGPDVIESILDNVDFLTFGSGRSKAPRDNEGSATGELEGGPHNSTHGFVGGDMGAFLSPRDPIFWMHHCNIDRLWATWQVRQGERSRSTLPSKPSFFSSQRSLTSTYWLKSEMGTFYQVDVSNASDNSATDITMTVEKTQKVADLGYTYSGLGSLSLQGTEPSQESLEPTLQKGTDLARSIEVNAKDRTVVVSFTRSPELQEIMSRAKERWNNPASIQPVVRLYARDVIVPLNSRTASLEFFLLHANKEEAPTFIGTYSFFAHTNHHETTPGKRATTGLLFDMIGPFKTTTAAGYDIVGAKGPVQVLVKVKSDNEFPDRSYFEMMKFQVEYDEYGPSKT